MDIITKSNNDLQVIKSNPMHLIEMYDRLSQEGKQRVLDVLNISLNIFPKDRCCENNVIPFTKMEGERK